MTNINKLRIVNILLLIGLSLAVVDEVKANLIATFTHNYGSGTGQIDPRGDDPLSDGYVQVTQKSATDLSNFYESFSSEIGGLLSGQIAQLHRMMVTFTYAESHAYFFIFPIESWGWENAGQPWKEFSPSLNNGGFISSSYEVDVTQGINISLESHGAAGNDLPVSFKLKSITLSLYGIESSTSSAPVPEPATMILFGTGLAGLAAARRRKKAC